MGVFAPSNAAFAKVPQCAPKRLLADKEKLAKVLTYHVLPSRVYADEIKEETVKTVEGSQLLLEPYHGKIYINRYAEVTAADIEGTNGNIHVINRVLFPLHLLGAAECEEAAPFDDVITDISVPFSTFDGAPATTQRWREVNDPVMGGQSIGSFQIADNVGVFTGEVKIVPSLKAPGFANMQCSGASFPDASTADALQLIVRSSVAYSGFKVAFGP